MWLRATISGALSFEIFSLLYGFSNNNLAVDHSVLLVHSCFE